MSSSSPAADVSSDQTKSKRVVKPTSSIDFANDEFMEKAQLDFNSKLDVVQDGPLAHMVWKGTKCYSFGAVKTTAAHWDYMLKHREEFPSTTHYVQNWCKYPKCINSDHYAVLKSNMSDDEELDYADPGIRALAKKMLHDTVSEKDGHEFRNKGDDRINIAGKRIAAHHWNYMLENNTTIPKSMILTRNTSICNHSKCIKASHHILRYIKTEDVQLDYSTLPDSEVQFKIQELLSGAQELVNEDDESKNNVVPGNCLIVENADSTVTYHNDKHQARYRIFYCLQKKKNLPSNVHVIAKCGNRKCLNINHLTEGSASDNTANSLAHGKILRGEDHPTSNISIETARQIKQSKGDGITRTERASDYNVTIRQVESIDRGHSFAYLAGPGEETDNPDRLSTSKKYRKPRPKRKLWELVDESHYAEAQQRILQKITKQPHIDPTKGDHWFLSDLKDKNGYTQISFKRVPFQAHKLSWIAFKSQEWRRNNPNVTEEEMLKMSICHKCQSNNTEFQLRGCVNPDHLEIGTDADQVSDKRRVDSFPVGSRSKKSKLTDAQAMEILTRHQSETISNRILAQEYNVTEPTIATLVKGKSYKYVYDEFKRSLENTENTVQT